MAHAGCTCHRALSIEKRRKRCISSRSSRATSATFFSLAPPLLQHGCKRRALHGCTALRAPGVEKPPVHARDAHRALRSHVDCSGGALFWLLRHTLQPVPDPLTQKPRRPPAQHHIHSAADLPAAHHQCAMPQRARARRRYAPPRLAPPGPPARASPRLRIFRVSEGCRPCAAQSS